MMGVLLTTASLVVQVVAGGALLIAARRGGRPGTWWVAGGALLTVALARGTLWLTGAATARPAGPLAELAVLVPSVLVLGAAIRMARRTRPTPQAPPQDTAEWEVALRRGESGLARVVARAPVVLYAVDPDGVFTLSSGRGLETLGLAPGEVVGRSVFEVYRDTPRIGENVRRALAGEEFRDRVQVGERVFEASYAPTRTPDGAVSGAIGVAIDVTEVERSEERYRTVVEQASDAIFITDVEGRYLDSNARASELLGYTAEEIKTMHIADVIVEDDLAREPLRLEELMAGRTIVTRRRLRRKDGTVVPVEISARKLSDGRLLGFVRDITERQRAEEALRRSEANYRALVEHATYGICRVDGDGRLESVNPALVRMLGYASETRLRERNLVRDIYVDPDAWHRTIDAHRRDGYVERAEAEWRRKDGSVIAVLQSGRLFFDDHGRLDRMEMIVEDVTERRALEAQLRQAQKMEAVGQLTGGIAHDFNNLLTVILTNADDLRRALPPTAPELHEDLDDLRRAAERGSDLVKKLLGFSRRGMLTLRPLALGNVVAELLPTLRRLLPESIEVRLIRRDDGAVVRGDEGALGQVLFNLATNARDAMRDGGRLDLEVAITRLGAEHQALEGIGAGGEYVRLVVRDDGSGMDAATKERIFDPFFTTKPPGVGSGLGMAMVYGLVKQQNGYIDLQSTPGEGTAINLYFPLVAAAPEAPDEADAAPAAAGAETILVVEDEAAIRRSAKRLLERQGYRVLLTGDGMEAFEVLRQRGDEIDLVISDVVMPRLGGMQLLERIREHGISVPFLFTSGYTTRDVRDSASLDPGIPFLKKPWDVEELLRSIRERLDAVRQEEG